MRFAGAAQAEATRIEAGPKFSGFDESSCFSQYLAVMRATFIRQEWQQGKYPPARNDRGASACVPHPSALTTCPKRRTALNDASSVVPPTVS